MWLKLKLGISSVILFSILLLQSGCLEEPTVAPVKRPYSVIRVINFSNSSNRTFIDSQDAIFNSVTVPAFTNYFDINSGKRRFVNVDSNSDTIFNANIEIISYNREIVVFAGTYSDVLENNTFSSMKISEGEIYINAMPDPGKVNIIVANAFPGFYSGSVEVNSVNLALISKYWSNPDSAVVLDTTISYDDDLLKFGISYNIINANPGSYKFEFLNSADSTLTIADSSYYEANKRYYLFVYGNPDILSVYRDEVESLPVRSIYEK